MGRSEWLRTRLGHFGGATKKFTTTRFKPSVSPSSTPNFQPITNFSFSAADYRKHV